MQDNDLYQHILGLSSPWTVRERSLGGTLATPTASHAMRQMGSQYQPDSKYQPDAPARETTSLIPPPKNPCWRDGLVLHGKPRLSQLSSRLTACRVLGHKRAECCDAEQRENFKKAIFFTCGGWISTQGNAGWTDFSYSYSALAVLALVLEKPYRVRVPLH